MRLGTWLGLLTFSNVVFAGVVKVSSENNTTDQGKLANISKILKYTDTALGIRYVMYSFSLNQTTYKKTFRGSIFGRIHGMS